MKTERLAADVNLLDVGLFRVENFPPSGVVPWLDRADWREAVAARERSGDLTPEQAALCTHWAEYGYVIVPGMFSDETLDATWREYESLIASKELIPGDDPGSAGSPLPGRTLNPHLGSPAIDKLLHHPAAIDLVSMLLGVECLPFQTIAGHKGSQQLAHSDSIHMTTFPQGYLVANWIAFEDISPDSGPLEYYPGSHRLPYTYSKDCGITRSEGLSSYLAYNQKYEPHVQRTIVESGLKASHFHAKKGDVLFWHANLLHGGSPIRDFGTSRHALVCHYFAEGCVCYHDYTGLPSRLTHIPFLRRNEFDAGAYLSFNPDVAAAGIDPYAHYVKHGYSERRPVRRK